MNSESTKSPDELKKEFDQQLRKIDSDINEMERRLTPGQLLDDAIFYPNGGNPRETFEHLKDNPVGTTFLAVGTFMLMKDENDQSYEHLARTKATAMGEKVTEVVDQSKEKLSQVSGQVKQQVSQKAHAVGEKLASVKSQIQTKASEVAQEASQKVDTAKARVGETVQNVENKVGEAKDQLGSTFQEAKDKIDLGQAEETVRSEAQEGMESVKQIDPLTVVAIGAGLGALTGAALPLTEVEKNFMEGHLSSQISGFEQDLKNAVNESASVLKDLVFRDIKDMNINVFRS